MIHEFSREVWVGDVHYESPHRSIDRKDQRTEPLDMPTLSQGIWRNGTRTEKGSGQGVMKKTTKASFLGNRVNKVIQGVSNYIKSYW